MIASDVLYTPKPVSGCGSTIWTAATMLWTPSASGRGERVGVQAREARHLSGETDRRLRIVAVENRHAEAGRRLTGVVEGNLDRFAEQRRRCRHALPGRSLRKMPSATWT